MAFGSSGGSIPPSWYNISYISSSDFFIALPQRLPQIPRTFVTRFYKDDAPALTATLSHPVVNNQLLAVPKPYHKEHAKSWIELMNDTDDKMLILAIRQGDPRTGEFIGGVGLTPSKIPERYMLGYYLHPKCHGSKIMKDAALAVLTYSIPTMRARGVHEVWVDARHDNPASQKTIESMHDFRKLDEEKEVDWPEHKNGNGIVKLSTWKWTVPNKNEDMDGLENTKATNG